MDVEVEDVRDLEVGAIHQHQVAADYNMRVMRRRRREHHFQFMRAGLELSSQVNRDVPANYDLSFQARRKVVALGQTRWKMLVVCPIPAAGGIAIVIGITIVVVSAAMFVVAFVAAFMIVTVAMIVIVIAVMLLLTVSVIVVVLRERNCRRNRHRKNCDGAGSKPGFR